MLPRGDTPKKKRAIEIEKEVLGDSDSQNICEPILTFKQGEEKKQMEAKRTSENAAKENGIQDKVGNNLMKGSLQRETQRKSKNEEEKSKKEAEELNKKTEKDIPQEIREGEETLNRECEGNPMILGEDSSQRKEKEEEKAKKTEKPIERPHQLRGMEEEEELRLMEAEGPKGMEEEEEVSMFQLLNSKNQKELSPVLPRLNLQNEAEQDKEAFLAEREPDSRFVLFPIHFEDIWNMYKGLQSSFWVAEDIRMEEDLLQWNETGASVPFRNYIKCCLSSLALITSSELTENLLTDIPVPEARCFYGLQIAMENIHMESYSMLFHELVPDSNEKDFLEMASQKWAAAPTPKDLFSFTERLVFSAFRSKILFSSFLAFATLKFREDYFPGMFAVLRRILKDRHQFTLFGCLIHNSYITHKLGTSKIHEITKKLVEIEKKFIEETFPKELLGVSSSVTASLLFVSNWESLVERGGHPEGFIELAFLESVREG